MVKRRVEWNTYVIIGVITFIFFFSGIFTGIYINKMKVDVLSDQVSQFRTSMTDTETMMLFLSIYGEDACDMLQEQLNALSEESKEIGEDVAFYESTKKVEEPYYLELKRNYMSIVLKHWLYNERAKTECKINSTTILFFYSNRYCEICEDEGTILSYIKNKYPDNLMIFAFDVDLDVRMINYLGTLYDFEVMETPVLIIEGNKYEGFLSKTDLEKIICESNSAVC